MVLVARIGAFVRAISAHDWHTSSTLDGATLLAASTQASRYEALLLPVLLVWAALLLLTPPGYTAAYRAAAIAAGALGYLNFIPPHFPVSTGVGPISRWLSTAGSGAVPSSRLVAFRFSRPDTSVLSAAGRSHSAISVGKCIGAMASAGRIRSQRKVAAGRRA